MADFRIRVVVDPTAAVAGTKRVEKGLERTNKTANRLRMTLIRAFGVLAGASLLLGAVRNLAQFEQAMSTVQAVTQATEGQFADLRKEAQRLGITTRFAATEAARAMVLLGRAGFNTAEILETVDDTLLLAQAGALDLAAAADITASSLRGFRLATSEAGRVTDVLALAANSANTDVRELGQAIKFVAPVAAGLGISLEVATAAITALSDAGLKGTLAGTGLRRVLAELEAPSARLQEALARVGKTLADVRPSTVGLTKALRVLKEAGVDTGEALEIFGQRGGPAFEVLSNSIPAIEEMTIKLGNAGGTALEVARIMDDNLNGALFRARSAIEGLNQSFGETGATNALTQSLNGLATVIRLAAGSIDVLVNALVIFGLALLAVKIGAFVKGLLASGAAFLKFQAAVSAGNIVLLNSAVASNQRAIAAEAAALAELSATQATLLHAKAQIATAVATTEGNVAFFARRALLGQIALLEAQAATQAAALATAQAAVAATAGAAAVQVTLFGRALQFALTAAIGGPIILGAIVAGLGALILKLADLDEGLKQIQKTQDTLQEDAPFAQLGAGISSAQREIGGLVKALTDVGKVTKVQQREISRLLSLAFTGTAEQASLAREELLGLLLETGAFSDSQRARVEKLITSVRGVRVEIQKLTAEQKELNKFQASQEITVGNLIDRLNREAESLKKLNKETEVQAALQLELDRLLQAGEVAGPEEKKAIENLLLRNQGLRLQRELLESILGPADLLARKEEALNALLVRRPELLAQIEAKREALRSKQTKAVEVTDPFEEQVQSLRDSNSLLEERLRLGDDAAEILSIELAIGRNLTKDEQDRLIALIARNKQLSDLERRRGDPARAAAGLDRLRKENELLEQLLVTRGREADALVLEARLGGNLTDAQKKVALARLENNAALRTQLQVIDELLGPQEQLVRTQDALNTLLEKGTINQEQFNQKLREAKIAALEADQSISGGFARGLLKVEEKINDVGSLAENVLVNAFGNAEDALVDFVRSGEVNFEQFVNQLLDDIARLLIRLLILQAVQAATGTAPIGAGANLIPMQEGGPVMANRPFLVGEIGPELFVPQGQGEIIPADRTAALAGEQQGGGTTVVQAPAPEVNVNITNVTDPDEMAATLASGQIDIEVLNVLGRNRGRAKQMLA